MAMANKPRLVLRKIAFMVCAIAFVPLFAALRSYLHPHPLYRNLIGTGVSWVAVVAAWRFLGRDPHPTLRAWRIFFVARAMLLVPMLLAIVDGLAGEGWPSGRQNRGIANALLLIITMSVPALLTGLCALIRTYRLAGGLALVAGLASLVDGVLILRLSWGFSLWAQRPTTVLGIIGFGSKVESYLAIPFGIALIVGGILTLRAARSSAGALQGGA
jgi:hypothetical protein